MEGLRGSAFSFFVRTKVRCSPAANFRCLGSTRKPVHRNCQCHLTFFVLYNMHILSTFISQHCMIVEQRFVHEIPKGDIQSVGLQLPDRSCQNCKNEADELCMERFNPFKCLTFFSSQVQTLHPTVKFMIAYLQHPYRSNLAFHLAMMKPIVFYIYCCNSPCNAF